MIYEIRVSSRKTTEFVDITPEIQKIVSKSGVKDGICIVYCPHTTAGITTNENADPTVKEDIRNEIDKIVPWDDNYRHLEGNSAAHIKSSLIGFSKVFIIDNGKLLLGTWQGIFFCEFDGPRTRKVYIKIIEG